MRLCAFTDLERKLKAWNDRGGQPRAGGATGANTRKANDKVNPKKSIANKKVSELQKKNQELEKKLKESIGSAGTDADGKKKPQKVDRAVTADSKDRLAAIKHRKSLNLQWMKANREEHIDPGTTDEARTRLGNEFDSSKNSVGR